MIKEAYTKSEMERRAELSSITSLGDRSPEHLLGYMRGSMPGEVKSALFRYIWLTALPDSIRQVLSADDSELPVLAAKAKRTLKEKLVKRKRIEQVNAVGIFSREEWARPRWAGPARIISVSRRIPSEVSSRSAASSGTPSPCSRPRHQKSSPPRACVPSAPPTGQRL